MEPLLYDSYPEQHRDEILKLFEVIETMEVPIIMGDFNHGPGGPGQEAWGVCTLICLGGLIAPV